MANQLIKTSQFFLFFFNSLRNLLSFVYIRYIYNIINNNILVRLIEGDSF